MSISDSEDLDSKPAAQPRATETPRRQKRGLNKNNNHGSGSSISSAAAAVPNMTLSNEQQIELSYQRAASLLRGMNNSDHHGNNKAIIIMPSLVSLSDDFFNINNNTANTINHAQVLEDMMSIEQPFSLAFLPDLPSNTNNIGSVASSAAATASIGNNNSTVMGGRRLQPRLNSSLGSDAILSTSSGDNNAMNNNLSNSGDDDLGNSTREDWPIGPQGAQVPEYLFERMNNINNNNIDGGNNHITGQMMTHSSSSTNDFVDIADILAAGSAFPSPQQPTAAAAATTVAGRNLQESPQRSAARRVRQIMTRHQQQPSSQQQSSQHPPRFINAVESLEHAVQRLEETLRQRDVDGHDGIRGLPGSGAYSISSPGGSRKKKNPSMEDVEVGTLTQLAEIMLHPPTQILNGKYSWRDNESAMMPETCILCNDDGKMDVGGYDQGRGGEDENNDDDIIADNNDLMNTSPSPTTSKVLPITTLVERKSRYSTLNAAQSSISTLGKSCPIRRVCQHPFRRNDIVWVCRTCQSDETCVLCHECFSNSNHEGHDVAFYHAQAGGCCDCGDADAWDPKGFCCKHGGQNGQGAPPGTDVAKVEPAVLGSVHACADWLVEVVQSGVESGYRRANPLRSISVDTKIRDGMARTGSLPESYDDPELERERQSEETPGRERNMARRNTVADMETTPGGTNDDDSRVSNYTRASNSIMSIEAAFPETFPSDFIESGNAASRLSTPIIHEVQFDPAAASGSRRRSDSNTTANTSKRDADSSPNDNIFCPAAASTSKSLLECRATKKARSPPKSPARALGDLGRDGRGLYLVIHSDDIRVGSQSPSEAINALKDFFSKSVSADNMGSETSWDPGLVGREFAFSGTAGPFPRPMGNNDGHINRPNIRIVPRLSRFRTSSLDSIVEKILRIIKKRGELIVWGTQELLAECGDVTSRCWRDGDPNSSALIGAAMLNRAKILTDGGLICSIKTRHEVLNEQTATSVITLINFVAQSCDPLCDQVSLGVSGRGITSTLPPLLRNDLKLPYKLVSSWHALLLTLLAVPKFKASLANAYCDTYRAVTSEYARGVGLIERSSYTLSVQFLNRKSYVTDLVRERRLIANLFLCLYEILSLATTTESPVDFDTASTPNLITAIMVLLGHASLAGGDDESLIHAFDAELGEVMNSSGGDSRHRGRVSTRGLTREHHKSLIERSAALNPKLDPTHIALTHRRYSVCISDLKCVLNVDGIARYFASLPCEGGDDEPFALNAWIKMLSLAQNMDGQCWKDYSQAHVERENSAWVAAFNTSISLGSLYERLLKWEDSDPSPIINGVSSMRLLSCAELCHYTLTKGVDRWQRGEILSCRPTPAPSSLKVSHALKSASLPFSTIASAHGTPLAMTALPLSQLEPFSFHLPLHRFAAACGREVSRRSDDDGGLMNLIDKFRVDSNANIEETERQLRKNDLLFRGMIEFPIIVLSRAAQIRSGIWKRNGPGMSDMVLNYSEPPFCRSLQDADIFLVQLGLVCIANLNEDMDDRMESDERSSFNCAATAQLVNLLVHRFGVFDFVGFDLAPPTDLDRYVGEIRSGMYPAEIKALEKEGGISSASSTPAMPWSYTPARDSSHEMSLLGELLHLFIIMISDLPPPPAEDETERAAEAQRRLMREVIHRLASGPKTHSAVTEVHHILSNRDTDVLCELGKEINPDDASGAALEEALNKVGTRKRKSGAPDEWELKESAWNEYDPSFHHISTRAHQQASENRPKQKADAPCLPYAPKPLPSHNLFIRLRRDLTADSTLLACIYRVLHVHCHRPGMALKNYPGKGMYDAEIKSETVLARAIHLLTLGLYAWEGNVSSININSTNWRSQGGGGIASVFEDFDLPPTASDWVEKVLLCDPQAIMQHEEYSSSDGSEQNILLLLHQISTENHTREQNNAAFLGGLDQSLKSGAMYICNFAAKVNNDAREIVKKHSKSNLSIDNAGDLAKRKNAAKEKALAAMRAQMAKFAANLGDDNDEGDEMSVVEENKNSNRDDSRIISTPVRQRADSTGLEAMDLSPHGDFILTPSIHPSTCFTPRSPQTPFSPKVVEQNETSARHFSEVPRCIICGADDKIDCDNTANGSTQSQRKWALAFCGFTQASRVIQGANGDRHIGVHTTLCGHAIHKSCCETYIKTSTRDRFADRLEGGKRREFRCPLCQRLSNCLVPFVDVAADWLDSPNSNNEAKASPSNTGNDEMAVEDLSRSNFKSLSLHQSLSSSSWWATRNDGYIWDGQCNFTPMKDMDRKQPSVNADCDDTRTEKIVHGKKELIKAWNQAFQTPRRSPSCFGLATPTSTENKGSGNSDILRKWMDQIIDVGQRADLKRLGEEELTKDYGPFRHYLTERTMYSKGFKALGREALDWPLCLTFSSMSEARKQELSKEKMISKVLYSIQAFTYSCCSESSDCRRLLRSKSVDKSSMYSKFGIREAALEDNLLLLPKADSSTDGGFQPFDGKLGKTRYMGLALMAAASPVAKEIVQLCMPFPFDSYRTNSVFEFDEDDSKTAKRAPVAYPILCGHILTHTTGALIAVTGNARRDEESCSIVELIDDCRMFVSLGLIARILQVLLTGLMSFEGDQIDVVVESMYQMAIDDSNQEESNWNHSCLDLLRNIFCREGKQLTPNVGNQDSNQVESHIVNGIASAKKAAVSFLLDAAVIVQILIPNIFSDKTDHPDDSSSDLGTMKRLMDLIGIESIHDMIQSDLTQQVFKSWYSEATEKEKDTKRLQPPPGINYETWPFLSHPQSNSTDDIPPDCSPLLGHWTSSLPFDQQSSRRITCIPKSYTDLYAQLSALCPDNDQIALCLVCGSVLDAGGKGECTKHASKCGGGCGVFFLVQECVGLIMHGAKAAYVPSIFVDSHGETPQYRGRPLNLDPRRWSLLQDMWCSHSVREKVISERSTTRQVIIPNYY